MALEDRDWYREEPSREWKTRWTSSPRPPTTTRRTGATWGAGAAVALLTVLWLTSTHWSAMPWNGPVAGPVLHVPAHVPQARTPGNVVHLRPTPGLDVPAARVGRWTISDPRFGVVRVYVPVGETPRQAVTVALAARGYQVVP